MTDPDLRQLLTSLEQLLGPHLRRSQPLRDVAALVGKWLGDQARQAADPPAVPPMAPPLVPPLASVAPPPFSAPPVVTIPTVPARTLPMSAATVPLKIGDSTTHVRVTGTSADIGRARLAADAPPPSLTHAENGATEFDAAEIDLALVEKRCRLKAESCRVFIDRRRAIGDPEHEPALIDRVASMIAVAKATPDCFLWVFWRERTQPDDPTLRVIAGCYDAMAVAVHLVLKLEGHGEAVTTADTEAAFQLLAEADSALRVALDTTWLTSPDADQDQVHRWLRRETAYRHVFVPHYMRLDDPADPFAADALVARVADLTARIDGRQKQSKALAGAIQQIRYHAKQAASKHAAGEAGDAEHDWRKIDAAIALLTGKGLASTDRRITEALLPVLRLEPPTSVETPALARALDAARARPAPAQTEPESAARAWSERVLALRALLAGRRVVIVGGERRPEKIDALVDALALAECEWVELVEHGSGRSMAAPIRRPETALVLILIRLAGHLHVDEAREYARDAGKPFVNIEAGYGVEQVADQTLTQVGDQLRAFVQNAPLPATAH